MGTHLIDSEFQSDKYPTTPRGKVPLSVKDPTAQDLLWEYAQRRRGVDEEFTEDLEVALRGAGFTRGTSYHLAQSGVPSPRDRIYTIRLAAILDRVRAAPHDDDVAILAQNDIWAVLEDFLKHDAGQG